ncbi:MAG: bifunctional fucokinase/L-fucose-1-P-guanylyltransferase [archaeon]|nr:bifunctional fucokinase/L-fucose-1-P-guanylyltransferase [archaeon]
MQSKNISLFLRQAYEDNWMDYERSLNSSKFIKWDYVIITASNEEQAIGYRAQIDYRLKNNLLPKSTHFAVLSDPDGKRVGSGGATLNTIKYIKEQTKDEDCFNKLRILLIHSGGDSKRIPQYSACGKLFSPNQRELPNGYSSTLFDELIIGLSTVPSRIQKGMLIICGDILLLFNPLQIDFSNEAAACISIKEKVEISQNHGVYMANEDHVITHFLHKMPKETLIKLGAANSHNRCNIDTGAALFNTEILEALFSLISKDKLTVDPTKYNQFINDTVRISFYADFLYPLASESTLEQFYKEKPEGNYSDELTECRKIIWEKLHPFRMKLITLSPAKFLHFGTTHELLSLTQNLSDYSFLNWKNQVLSTSENKDYSAYNSLIEDCSSINKGSYIENSYVLNSAKVGKNSIISNVSLSNCSIPDDIVLHGLKTKNGKYIIRIYAVNDNPKDLLEKEGKFLNISMKEFLEKNNLKENDLWDNEEHFLWTAKLYKACDTMEEALNFALNIYKMTISDNPDINLFKSAERQSLNLSFNNADSNYLIEWESKLRDEIRVQNFLKSIKQRKRYDLAAKDFGMIGVTERQKKILLDIAEKSDFSTKIRIYYYLSKILNNELSEELETKCFSTICSALSENSIGACKYNDKLKITKDEVKINLPLRVNFGGAWSDTPPICNEVGGSVLNAAIKINGTLPIESCIKKIDEKCIIFESVDVEKKGKITDIKDLKICNNVFDPFCIHKASLIACGIVPLNEDISLEQLLNNLGSGFYLSTRVINIPKGSGLGTSSILAGAMVKAIYEFMGQKVTDNEIIDKVLVIEQIMSTGGGWQDQVGGIANGIKLITTDKGLRQIIHYDTLRLSKETLNELQSRFALIYTGQRRLARNILREVIGGFIGGNEVSISVIHDIQRLASLMKFELEKGNIDEFASLLTKNCELSTQLDKGMTNSCINEILLVIEDLICGKMICGAGGGGFIQVILKKGVSIDEVKKRLYEVFQDVGVEVWDYEFV